MMDGNEYRRIQADPVTDMRLLSIGEVAKILKKRRSFVIAEIKSGRLPCIRDGARYKIRPCDLERYMSECSQSGVRSELEPSRKKGSEQRSKIEVDPKLAALFQSIGVEPC